MVDKGTISFKRSLGNPCFSPAAFERFKLNSRFGNIFTYNAMVF
jgi:hypothetical protein